MLDKKRVLIFYDYFSPAYKAGGPIRSLRNLVELLHLELDLYVYTSNTDHDGSVLNVMSNEWADFSGMAKVYYASSKYRYFSSVKKVISEIQPDVIHINGIFSFFCVVHPIRVAGKKGIPLVISPRGMLQQASLRQKAFKKKVYLWFLKNFVLPSTNVTWHVTTKQEEEDLTELFQSRKISQVGNIPHLAEFNANRQKNGVFKMCTVALVSPMKNHHLVLEALHGFKEGIIYDIYGPIKDQAYWGECQKQISALPKNIQVNYCGEIEPPKVDHLWENYDFYVQPSQSENFGHSIFEALSAGLPVIISDQTPWMGLEAIKAGWDVDTKKGNGVQTAIQKALRMPPEEYHRWSGGARALAEKYLKEADLKNEYLKLYGSLMLKSEGKSM